jgi:hypothetical protein
MRCRALGLLLGTLTLLGLSACSKREREPSGDYARAREIHTDLLARFLDDAYGRAEIDEVLRLLERVPADSADAEAAADLRRRVLQGKDAWAIRKAAQEQSATARRALELPALDRPQPTAAPPPPTAPTSPLDPGTKLADFKKALGDCFESKMPADIRRPDGGTAKGEAWGVKSDPACREQYRAQADSYVFFLEDALLEIRPISEIESVQKTIRVIYLPDGSWVPVPDGGAP